MQILLHMYLQTAVQSSEILYPIGQNSFESEKENNEQDHPADSKFTDLRDVCLLSFSSRSDISNDSKHLLHSNRHQTYSTEIVTGKQIPVFAQ